MKNALKQNGGLCELRCIITSHISPYALKWAAEEGRIDKVINPFDEIDIPIDTGGTITVVCAYSDEKSACFVFKDCWDACVMNVQPTNQTGYYGSAGRKHVLEDIYPHLPQEWKDIIKPRELVETIDGKEVRYADPLWLPSVTDVFGASENGDWAEEPDSFPLPIFRCHRDRVKECEDYIEFENYIYSWWLRSINKTKKDFCFVSHFGLIGADEACRLHGFAPGFDI